MPCTLVPIPAVGALLLGVALGEPRSEGATELPDPGQLVTRSMVARFGSSPSEHREFTLSAKTASGNSSLTFFAAVDGRYRYIRTYLRPPRVLPAVSLGGDYYPAEVLAGGLEIVQESGFDGEYAWSRAEGSMPSWVDARFRDTRFGAIEELDHAVRYVLDPWSPQHLLDDHEKARTVAAQVFLDVPCYVVELERSDGRTDRLYIEEQSGHIRGLTFDLQAEIGDAPETWALLEYAEAEGVMVPSLVTRTCGTTDEFRVIEASFRVERPGALDAPPRLGAGLFEAPLDVLERGRVDLRDHVRTTPVVLFFGGSGCPPSRLAQREIEAWLEDRQGELTCFGVDTWSTDDQSLRRTFPEGGNIRGVRDVDRRLAETCGVAAVPAAVLIDREGVVTALPSVRTRAFWEILDEQVSPQ